MPNVSCVPNARRWTSGTTKRNRAPTDLRVSRLKIVWNLEPGTGDCMTPSSMPERAEEFRKAYRRVKDEIGKAIVGHSDIVDGVLTCLFVAGHAVLGGVPGLAKAMFGRTVSQLFDLESNRRQVPSDGTPAE